MVEMGAPGGAHNSHEVARTPPGRHTGADNHQEMAPAAKWAA